MTRSNTTTYSTTRLTSVTRTAKPAPAPVPVHPVAKLEIINYNGDNPNTSVLVDGIMPLVLAQMFTGLVAAHNAGTLRLT